MAAIGSPWVRSHVYTAYGISFAVPFRCPTLPAAEVGITPDVVVSDGAVARRLSSAVVRGDRWDAEPGRFLLRGGRRAGRFLVQAGQVTLERNPAAEHEMLARCFTDEVLPALLRQRGLLVLHANAALTPRGVVILAGRSGAGKSTTLAALIERGCTMLADDITALTAASDGYVEVMRGVAQVRLTTAAARAFGYDLGPAAAQPWRQMKSALGTEDKMAPAPGRLRAIYVLATNDTASVVQVRALSGVAKFDALQSCIYGPMFADEHPGAFLLARAIMRTADVHRVERPSANWTLAEVAEIILDGGLGASK